MTDCYASKYKTACLCSFIIFFAQSKKYFIYVCTTIGRHKPYHSGKQSSTCLGCIGTITLQVAMSGMSSHIHHPSVEERFSLGKKNLNTVSLLVVLQSHRLSLLWNTERERVRERLSFPSKRCWQALSSTLGCLVTLPHLMNTIM